MFEAASLAKISHAGVATLADRERSGSLPWAGGTFFSDNRQLTTATAKKKGGSRKSRRMEAD